MQKKKIAIVARNMCIGGVERALSEMTKVFDYDHYDLDIWLVEKTGELLQTIDSRANVCSLEEINGRCGIRFFIIKQFNRFLARVCVSSWFKNEHFHEKTKPRCYYPRYECVISFNGYFSVVNSTLYRFAGRKKLLWVHGEYKCEDMLKTSFDFLYNKFDHVFCVSESARTMFSETYHKAGRKTSVIYNVIDSPCVREKADIEISDVCCNTMLVTVGRIAVEKGQIMVPKATRLLLDSGYDIHWYLVGDGSMRREVEEEIKKYSVEDRVILLGTKENPYPYIKNCDIYVQPSFSEGYCTTTMEAKILGKPIVTTDAPGMREQFVSGENGLIVEAMTPEAIADGIKYLIDHPEVRERFVENLKNEDFSGSNELQKLYDFIES